MLHMMFLCVACTDEFKIYLKKPIIICFILLMLCVTILFPQSQNAYANTKDVDTYTRYEHIESFDSQIFVHKNGTIDVEETIEYDFG